MGAKLASMKWDGIRSKGRGAAFTLIELLVVMGILGLLGGIGLSGVQAIRRSIQGQADQAFLIEIQTACRLYFLEHNRWPDGTTGVETELTATGAGLAGELAPYMETPLMTALAEQKLMGRGLYVVLDQDRDHWIRPADFVALGTNDRPAELWERSAIYYLDAQGNLIASTWDG